MDAKSYRQSYGQNNELLLRSWFQKFCRDELFFDIEIDNNPNILQNCDELAEIFDEYCPAPPFMNGCWVKYLPSRIGKWHYIRCGKSAGTASDEPPNGREVVTADRIIEIARGSQWLMDEDFDSVLN